MAYSIQVTDKQTGSLVETKDISHINSEYGRQIKLNVFRASFKDEEYIAAHGYVNDLGRSSDSEIFLVNDSKGLVFSYREMNMDTFEHFIKFVNEVRK